MQTGYILTQLLNGLVLGMTLVLISLGLTIIFGMMGVVNFAHGDILLAGTYVAWTIGSMTGSFIVAVVAAAGATALVGVAIERLLLRWTYGRHGALLQLLLTFGIAELLRGLIQIVWGRTGKNFPTPGWGQSSIDFVLFSYPSYRLFVIAAATIVVVGTYLFTTRTDLGLIIRAGTQDREMVDILGINVAKVFTIVFAIGCALAGAGGALIGPIRGAYPTLGIELLIPAFVVVVIGGLGSFRGSVLAGILVGEVSVMTGMFYSSASQVIIYILMALVLLLRPRGLFGKEGVMG